MQPAAAWACLVLILAGVVARRAGSRRARYSPSGTCRCEKPPDALVERAKEIIRPLGYTEKPRRHARGASPATASTGDWVERARPVDDPLEGHWQAGARPRSTSGTGRARARSCLSAPRRRLRTSLVVRERSAARRRRGMVGVELDPLGRLLRFEAVPPQVDASAAVRGRARLDASLSPQPGSTLRRFTPADAPVASAFVSDARACEGREQPRTPGRAAARRGRGVSRTARRSSTVRALDAAPHAGPAERQRKRSAPSS